jgi:hypothetical protein
MHITNRPTANNTVEHKLQFSSAVSVQEENEITTSAMSHTRSADVITTVGHIHLLQGIHIALLVSSVQFIKSLHHLCLVSSYDLLIRLLPWSRNKQSAY